MWQSQALERMIDQAFSREVEEVLAFFSVNLDSGLSRDQVEQVMPTPVHRGGLEAK